MRANTNKMLNKRFIQNARERRNPDQLKDLRVNFPNLPTESFIMTYSGPHMEFFQELISKTNDKTLWKTGIRIPPNWEENIDMIGRMAIVSTIAEDPILRSANLWPITPTQSEHLIHAGKLAMPEDRPEYLALVLYDPNPAIGGNILEVQTLYKQIKIHRHELRLSKSDLEKRLIIVNAGIKTDIRFTHRIQPIIIPGVTQVYHHEILKKFEKMSMKFWGYGLEGGLPLLDQLNQGEDDNRTLVTGGREKIAGLYSLISCFNHSINIASEYIGDRGLGFSEIITFAKQEAA